MAGPAPLAGARQDVGFLRGPARGPRAASQPRTPCTASPVPRRCVTSSANFVLKWYSYLGSRRRYEANCKKAKIICAKSSFLECIQQRM